MTLDPLIATRTTVPVALDVRRRARMTPLITYTNPSKNPALQIKARVSTVFALVMLRDLRSARPALCSRGVPLQMKNARQRGRTRRLNAFQVAPATRPPPLIPDRRSPTDA